MTIRDRELYMRNSPNWACFDGCFGGRISPMDIDGCVEINGHVLFLEAKDSRGSVKTGQALTFKTLARLGAAVVVIFHTAADPLTPTGLQVWTPEGPGPLTPCTMDQLRDRMTAWAKRAKGEKSA